MFVRLKRFLLVSVMCSINLFGTLIKKGIFLVKSTYMVSTIPPAQMINAQNHPLPWSKIWSLDIPPKIKHFFWKACNKVILVKENLVKRNINTPLFPNVHVMHKLE